MRLLSGTSSRPIGVDIGCQQIKAVQLQGVPGRWAVSAAGVIERDNPGESVGTADVVQLREMLAKNSFVGNRVILAVPGNQLLSGIMELPPRSSGAPLEQLARTELSRMHRCEPDSFEMACWDLPAPARAGGATYVMAAGYAHAHADELIDTVESEGLNVYAMDIHASAVSRACSPLLEGVTGVAAILDLGWDHANLVLLYQGVVVYERKLGKCGISTVVDSLVRELKLHRQKVRQLVQSVGLSSEHPDIASEQCHGINNGVNGYCEKLVEEMRIPLSYLGNQYPDASPETLLLIGGGAQIPGLDEKLNSVLDFYVRTVLSVDIAKCSSDIQKQFGPLLTVAAGMGQFSERDR
ncbi:MAG: pilus assembly protein PilM [bacterium]|nr:pilus assembly protein PilM [bacterium]